MVVDVHLRLLPVGILVPSFRQGLHGGFIDRLEEMPPRYLQFLQGPGVEVLQLLPDRPVEIADAEEGVVPQSGDDPPFCDEHRRLHLRLVFWLFHPRGDDGGAIVRAMS